MEMGQRTLIQMAMVKLMSNSSDKIVGDFFLPFSFLFEMFNSKKKSEHSGYYDDECNCTNITVSAI